MSTKFGFENKFSTSDSRKCYGCGSHYKGTTCNCHKGVDIDVHRHNMTYWNNYQPMYNIYTIARGLIYLNFEAFALKDEKKLTVYWQKAKEEEKKEARQLWQDGWRPKRILTTTIKDDRV